MITIRSSSISSQVGSCILTSSKAAQFERERESLNVRLSCLSQSQQPSIPHQHQSIHPFNHSIIQSFCLIVITSFDNAYSHDIATAQNQRNGFCLNRCRQSTFVRLVSQLTGSIKPTISMVRTPIGDLEEIEWVLASRRAPRMQPVTVSWSWCHRERESECDDCMWLVSLLDGCQYDRTNLCVPFQRFKGGEW